MVQIFQSDEWVKAWHETIGKEWELVEYNLAHKGNELIIAGGYEVADYLDCSGSWDDVKVKYHGYHLTLRNVPESSPTVKYFQMEKEDTTPITELPPVLGKKYRHEMERKIRKFEREQTDIELKEGNNIESLLTLMRLDARKKEFLTPEMEEFFRRIHTMGTITELLVGGKPAAAMLTFAEGDMLMGYNSGFDEANFSGSGFYLKAKMLELAQKKGFKKFNFLQGNERYKYELGGKDFFVYKAEVLL